MIVNLILKSALVRFSLLSASYYCNLTELVCYVYLAYNPYSHGKFKPFQYVLFVNHHKTLLITQISNKFLYDIFQYNYLLQTSTYTTSQKRQSPTHRKHLKTETYQGSSDCGEGYSGSDLNRL